MGGMMCFHLTLKRPKFFSGVIFLAPALRDLPNYKILKKMAKIIGYFFPTIGTMKCKFDNSCKYNCLDLFNEDQHNYMGPVIPGAYSVVLNAL